MYIFSNNKYKRVASYPRYLHAAIMMLQSGELRCHINNGENLLMIRVDCCIKWIVVEGDAQAGCKSKPRKPLTVSQENFVKLKAGPDCLLPAEGRNI